MRKVRLTKHSVSIHEAGHAFAAWSIGEVNPQLSIKMKGGIVSRFGVLQEDYIKGQSEYIPSY
jgi:hypothetical protein